MDQADGRLAGGDDRAKSSGGRFRLAASEADCRWVLLGGGSGGGGGEAGAEP